MKPDKKLPLRNFVFGFNYPKESRAYLSSLTAEEKKSILDLSYFNDLFKAQFPKIDALSLGPPLYIELSNENNGSILIDSSNIIRYSDIFYTEDPSYEIVWEKFYSQILKISEKLSFTNVKNFGVRIIEKIPSFSYLQKSEDNFTIFLKDKKIFDNKTKYLFFKNTAFFEKSNNKRYSINFEPVFDSQGQAFFDLDVRIKMEIPVTNLSEIVKQEIRYYTSIKNNLK